MTNSTPEAATFGRKACQRCGLPIVEKQEIIRWEDGPSFGATGRKHYVHNTPECRAANQYDEIDSASVVVNAGEIEEADHAGLPEVTLDDLVKTLTTELLKQTAIDAKLDQYKKSATDKAASLIESLQSTVEKTISEAIDKRDARVIKLVDRSGNDLELGDEEHYHQQFEQIARHCDLRRNIFLFGATGAGKTHTAVNLIKPAFF